MSCSQLQERGHFLQAKAQARLTLAVDHCVTRPSVEMETSISSCSRPLSTHFSLHTGSLCFPVRAELDMLAVPCRGRVAAQTAWSQAPQL